LRGTAAMGILPEAMQDHLLAGAEWRRLAPREALFQAGDNRPGLFGVASGTIGFESGLAGAELSLVTLAPAPLWIIGQPDLDGRIRVNSGVARTDLLVAHLSGPAVAALLAANPAFYPFLIRVVAGLFWMAMAGLADGLIPDNRQRCIATLLRAGGVRQQGDAAVTVPISHEELSTLSNLSRQSVAGIVHELADAGLVALGYRRLTLVAPARLRALLAES